MSHLQIDKISVSAFRGIRGPVEIDFSAPLTVLVADNGTGKTSLCDAVEWAVTGRVQRLQDKIPDEQLAHAAGEAGQTFVRMNLHVGGVPKVFTRSLVGSETRLTSTTPGWRRLTDRKLLEELTPAQIGMGTRIYHQDINRGSWLRAVRFLTPDNLVQLIDSDQESDEMRQRLFAALLGAGHLKDSIKNLRKVLGEFRPSLRDLQESESKLAALRKIHGAISAEATAPYFERFDEVIRQAAALLETPASKCSDLGERSQLLVRLQESAQKRRLEQDQRNSYLAKLAEDAVTVRAQSERTSELRSKIIPRVATDRRNRSDEEMAANKLVVQLAGQMEEITGKNGALRERLTEMDAIIRDGQPMANTLGDDSRLLGTETEARLVGEASMLDIQLQQANLRIIGLTRLKRDWNRMLESIRSNRNLQVNRRKLEAALLPAKESQDLLGAISTLGERIAAARAQQEKDLSQNQLWTAEVNRQLGNWKAYSACPLCGHDHGSAKKLHDSINRILVLGARPPFDQVKDLEAMYERYHALSTKRDEQLARLEELRALADQMEAYTKNLAEAAEQVSNAGMDMMVFEQPDGLQRVATDLTKETANLKDLQRRITANRRDRELFTRFRNLAQEATRLIEPFEPDLRLLVGRPPLDQSSPVEWMRRLIAAKARADAQFARLLEHQREMAAKLEAARKQLEELRKARHEADAQLQAFEVELKQNEGRMRNWLIDANALGVTSPDESHIVDARARANALIKSADDAWQHLAIAGKHLEGATIAENHRVQRARLDVDIKSEEHRLAVLRREQEMKTSIETAIAGRETELDRWIQQESKPLQRVINALFLRAQSNSYIERINPAPTEGDSLQWRGDISGDRQLLAEELSQGQRQDLALAVFLARARHEGGTFVMDEPLAHLDDVNRLAILDSIRAMVVANNYGKPFRLILTTASWALARHLKAKFYHVTSLDGTPALKVFSLSGNPKTGLSVETF